ncbi:MAG: ISNCY family transposase [Phycisphaerales bacterium]|nr:ISNCY family transposase [Phycisphaerales bacterium]
MREEQVTQTFFQFGVFPQHERSNHFANVSNMIDQHPEIIQLVALDLRVCGEKKENKKGAGRNGISAESILRCAILKRMYVGVSYYGLEFDLIDRESFRTFSKLEIGKTPTKSTLQRTISAIGPETWEAINRVLVQHAREEGVEDGSVIRIDSTVVEALMHEPTDNSLLNDAVRVMARLFRDIRKLPGGAGFRWKNYERRAKRHSFDIQFCKNDDVRKDLYKNLLGFTKKTADALENALNEPFHLSSIDGIAWGSRVTTFVPLVRRVIDQCERRVFNGEKVPARDKLVSLFEYHADIIIKGSRGVEFGHKINITSTPSNLITDLVIEAGNPADSERLMPMLKRHTEQFGSPPKQVACDGGYASARNLADAKELGVKDMAFHKKCHLSVEDMCESEAVYNTLRNFRAGIEANISCLKRAYGLSRCNWRGLRHFQAYVWSAAVAYNLATLARLCTS